MSLKVASTAIALITGLTFGLEPMLGVQGMTFTVTKTSDTSDGICDTDCSLREAVNAADAAPGSDSVVLPAGVYYLTLGQLNITDGITLIGAGATGTVIDGSDLDRVIDVTTASANVELSGVTIRGGRTPCGPGCDFRFPGGGIRSSAALTLTDSVVTSNRGGSGGGIASSGTLTLINTTVSDNLADIGGSGGGIRSDGPLSLIHSIVSGNTASSGGGISNSGGSLMISNSTISGNKGSGIAGTGGGGISNSAPATLINSTVSGNIGDGGIVYFGLNATDTMTIVNSTISGNTGIAYGSVTIRGGGVSHRGGILTLVNSTVSGNTANGYGGGITVEGGTLNLNNVTITNNTADSDMDGTGNGGGLYRIGGGVNVKNSIIAGNLSGNPFIVNPDCMGTVTSQGYNLIGDVAGCDLGADPTTKTGVNATLGSLRNNGGPTLTHALLAGSPAIDAGNPVAPGTGGNACEATDQRGFMRPVGAACDIGAYEYPISTFLPCIWKGP